MAERTPPRYRTTRWKGHENFECVHCPFATLDRGQMVNHVRTRHPTAAELKRRRSAPSLLAGVDFASDNAAEAALSTRPPLAAADFQSHEPTGQTGYTVADVRAIAAARTTTPEEE